MDHATGSMKTFSLVNLKGGAGKTTSAVAIGAWLAEKGHRTLLIDLDPQGTLTRWLQADAQATQLMQGENSPELSPAAPDGLYVLGADRSLAQVESFRASKLARRLEKLLAASEDAFDFCLIDPPPSVGSLVLAALMASEGVISPVEASPGAVDGFSHTLQLIQRTGGAGLSGAFACRVDLRTKSDQQVPPLLLDTLGDVRDGGKALDLFVRETVQMREAQADHKPPHLYDRRMTAAADYEKIANQLLSL